MARKRMIDPDFWQDEKVGKLTPVERLLFIGMWNFADDEGYGRAGAALLKSNIFPYDDNIRTGAVKTALEHIANLNMIILYSIEEQNYYYIRNFLKHQTINKPTKSTFPKPEYEEMNDTTPLPDNYGSDTGVLPPKLIEENIIEENIKEVNTHARTKPTKVENDKTKYSDFVNMTEDEYNKLVEKYGEAGAKRMIEILDNYKGSTGKKYASDYRAILNWVVERYTFETERNGTTQKRTYGGGKSGLTPNEIKSIRDIPDDYSVEGI